MDVADTATMTGEPLDHALIRARLSQAGGSVGVPLVYLPVVGSTNDVAGEMARTGASHGTTVVADAQTAGRGRRGKAPWQSPQIFALLRWAPTLADPFVSPPRFVELSVSSQLMGEFRDMDWSHSAAVWIKLDPSRTAFAMLHCSINVWPATIHTTQRVRRVQSKMSSPHLKKHRAHFSLDCLFNIAREILHRSMPLLHALLFFSKRWERRLSMSIFR